MKKLLQHSFPTPQLQQPIQVLMKQAGISVERLTKITTTSNSSNNTSTSSRTQTASARISIHTPYINRNHLKHLDTVNMERNMQIRHDLMVEEGYRASLPRLDLSEEDEEIYWNAIRVEVAELAIAKCQGCPKLRALLSEIRNDENCIRSELVTSDFSEFLEDTHFIVQQLKNGALDIHGFFQFPR